MYSSRSTFCLVLSRAAAENLDRSRIIFSVSGWCGYGIQEDDGPPPVLPVFPVLPLFEVDVPPVPPVVGGVDVPPLCPPVGGVVDVSPVPGGVVEPKAEDEYQNTMIRRYDDIRTHLLELLYLQ